MIRYLFIIILIIAAVLLGIVVRQDPGYMLLAFHHWTVEMPLWLGILVVVFGFWLIYSIIRFFACLFNMPERVKFWSNRRKLKKAQQKTNRGLIALAEGHFAAAEKLLTQSASMTPNPLINYLGAARAAQSRGAYDKRDNYLRAASKAAPNAEIAIGLTQAELQIEKQQLEQALATLTHLQAMAPHHKYVLLLLKNIYLQLKDWSKLQELLPALKKYKVLESEQLKYLSLQIYQQRLLATQSLATTEIIWSDIPKQLRKEPILVASFIPKLINNGKVNQAEKLLRETLKHHWDIQCLKQYAELPVTDTTAILNQLEQWLKTHSDNANLLLILGNLSFKNQLWGKARSYYEASIAIQPSKAAYIGLAQLAEQLGELKTALQAYKQAQILEK